MRNIYLIGLLILIALVSCEKKSDKSYPEADAVYLNLEKTFVLNKDGSIVTTTDKQQKLLTYRSFQSLYGETRINYNPGFQKVEIQKAFTTNAEGQKIAVPENGVNEVLPGFCANSKALNHLREKVISHTGLERDAVINCSWSVTTDSEVFPCLMGDEVLVTNCPIEKLRVVVKVPENVDLNYKLLHSTVKPTVKKDKEYKTYTWVFNDLPQHLTETLESEWNATIPRLIFTTQTDQSVLTNWIKTQEAFTQELPETAKEYLLKQTKDISSTEQKILKAQEIVVNELNWLHVPDILIAFRVRPPQEVWQSNSGTTFEKCCLLASMLQSMNIESEVCLQYPSFPDADQLPFILFSEPFVLAKTATDMLYLSADHLNPNASEFSKMNSTILSLQSGSKTMKLADPQPSEINISGKIALNTSGHLNGELKGEFSNNSNPYYRLLRDNKNTANFVSEISGKVESLTSQRLILNFELDKMDWVEKRGDFSFIRLPESSQGFDAYHLNPLPFNRKSALDFEYPIHESYSFTFVVPDKYSLVNPVKIDLLKPEIGQVSIVLKQTGNEVFVSRTLQIFNPVILATQYNDLKELTDLSP